MPKLGLFLDEIRLPGARLFTREPYVVAVAVCETTRDTEVRVQTQPVEGVKKSRPAKGLGVELLAPTDPGSYIACRLLVMESDNDHRRAAERIDHARHLLSTTALGRAIVTGIAGAGVAAVAVDEAAGIVATLLRADGDDVLLEETLRIEGDDLAAHTWDVAGGKAEVTLRLAGDAATFPARADETKPAKKGGGKKKAPAAAPPAAPPPATETPTPVAAGAADAPAAVQPPVAGEPAGA
jgi:hypothetical protein